MPENNADVRNSLRSIGVKRNIGRADAMPPAMRVFFERPWLEGNITVDRGPLAGACAHLNGADGPIRLTPAQCRAPVTSGVSASYLLTVVIPRSKECS